MRTLSGILKVDLKSAVVAAMCMAMLCTWARSSAQFTAAYSGTYALLTRADELYEDGLFRQAYETYDAFLNTPLPPDAFIDTKRIEEAELSRAEAALRCNHPDGEQMMQEVIRKTRPDPIYVEATMDIANFYYNSGRHDLAIPYYNSLPTSDLDRQTLSEARFKAGYGHFVRKEYGDAENAFSEVIELKTAYYYPTNYYYGMCRFYAGDYTEALTAFQKVSQSDKYADHVPYYIAQIYFAQGKYEELIHYAEPKLAFGHLKHRNDLNLLIGRAYYETGNYAAAQRYLLDFVNAGGQLRTEDRYQLGYALYRSGEYAGAIPQFQAVANRDDDLGQHASFYLADCYLQTEDLQGARNAFRNASKIHANTDLREEALLQYGKLSAQLHYDKEAIEALDNIPSASQWHSEAQQALRDLFINSRDYASTLTLLQSLPDLSPALRSAYQTVSLNRGMQLLNDNRLDDADAAFIDVDKYPVDPSLSAQALFWRAEIAYRNHDWNGSADLARKYFTVARTASDLPPESSVALANYLQGYNYLHQQNYILAQSNFADAIGLMNRNSTFYGGRLMHTVLPDAQVRAADCAFKRNLYADALQLYADALAPGGPLAVYAAYQRAIIFGLQHHPREKIRILKQLTIDHPESELADDALFQLGITYQETGDGKTALLPLQQLIHSYPNSELYVATLLRLGLISYNNGNIQSALGYYKQVFEHEATAEQGREALSSIEEIYVQDLKTPDAYFAFVETVPGYQLSTIARDSLSYRTAEIQYEQAEYEPAIKGFTEYLNRYPSGIYVTQAYFYRGDAHAILKQYGAALSDFETVAKRGQSGLYIEALSRAAVLAYNDAKDFQKAQTYYMQLYAAVTDPARQLEAALGIVRSAYRADNYDAVLQWYDAVIHNAQVDSATTAEAIFYAAKAHLAKKDYAEALPLFKQVSSRLDNIMAAESRYRVAQLYYFLKQPDEAEKACNAANELNGNYPYWVAKSLILISDIAVDRNDLFNAKAPLEAVIENFQGDPVILDEAKQKLATIKDMELKKLETEQDTTRRQ